MSTNRKVKKNRIKVRYIVLILGLFLSLSFFCIVISRVLRNKTDYEESVHNQQDEIYESVAPVIMDKEDDTVSESESSQENSPAKENEAVVDEIITDLEEEIDNIVTKMSLEEKVYQIFVVTPEQLTGVGTVTAAGETTKECLTKYPVGGLIYLSPNLLNSSQTADMLANTQKYAMEIEGMPMFLCVDEEGGRVSRIGGNKGFAIEKCGPMSEVGSKEEAYNTGCYIGNYLSELGFNVDFAPDADVLTNKENSVIGDRSFGSNPEFVKDCAVSFAEGLKKNGILSTFKHFPGHGSTSADTHKGFAYTDKTLEELKEAELVPFMVAQDAGIDMVMVAHISVPSICGDNTPCSLSHHIITDVLREELGFDGIVITDAMNMGAITSVYQNDEAVIKAVKAGSDMILSPQDFKSASSALIKAIESGEIEEETIDIAVRRIVSKKLEVLRMD